jgi:hypothetical protein
VSEDCVRGPATEERVSRELFERVEGDAVNEDCARGAATEEQMSRKLFERTKVTL